MSTPTIEGVEDLKVAALMAHTTFTWEYELLEELFCARGIAKISCIPLTWFRGLDFCIRNYNKNGLYTVKSGYKVTMNLLFSEDVYKCLGIWELIWDLKFFPRVEMFLWRLGSGCLPTRMRIQSRSVVAPICCGLCDKDVEYIFHLFLACPFANACWK